MKLFSITLSLLLMIGGISHAQVAVSDSGCTPHISAVFEVHSATKGFLGPQVALTSITSSSPVITPATGLLVFNTTDNGILQKGYYFWNATRWVPINVPLGNNEGDMLCWNGIQWVRVPAGTTGDVLTFTGGTPIWAETQAQEPSILTDSVTLITSSTALSGGNVSDNGAIVTERGLVYSTTPNPTTTDNKTLAGAGSGAYDKGLDGLTPNSTYYVRAYATNSIGTGYGDEKTFTTPSGVNTITTATVTAITPGSAVSGGTITDEGGEPVTARGVCWSTSSGPTIANPHTEDGTGTGTFTSNMTGLLANTTYFVKAYATSVFGSYYGNELSFTTASAPVPPTLTTTVASNVNTTSASSGGNITSGGGSPIYFRGVCWNTNTAPTTANNHTVDGAGTGVFVSSLTGLAVNTLIYYRAYLVNSLGTFYANELTLTTLTTVTTTTVNNITQTTATCGGNVTVGGEATITARGVCWATTANPTLSDSHTINGGGTGTFGSNLIGLTANTYYYVRAYATNSGGTTYGNQQTFTTSPPPPTPPIVTTTIPYSVTTTSATSGGEVISEGGAPVTARGVCWEASSNPTISDDTTLNGSGLGVFFSQITGLSSNHEYHVRAYAISSAGTSYGPDFEFRTLANQTLPTVTTTILTNITPTTATCGGNITLPGGSPVLFRGVCWSTSTSPTLADNHTIDGSGIGAFVSSITGLAPGTNYYVRAYAMNSAGTAYGNEVSINNPYYIGASYGGGIIFYIDGAGQHGLVAAAGDQGSASWGCEGTSIPGTSTTLGSGQSNTTLIVTGCTPSGRPESGIAALICDTLTLNSYTDWFLPSKDELNLMYQQKTSIGGFFASEYWSSSEYNAERSWKQSFSIGTQSDTRKDDRKAIRAIRDF